MSLRVAFNCDCFMQVGKAEICLIIHEVHDWFNSKNLYVCSPRFNENSFCPTFDRKQYLDKSNPDKIPYAVLFYKEWFLKTQLKQRWCAAYDHEKKSKGFAHLDFVSVESAQAAVADSGRYFWGKELRVASAHPRPTTDPATKRIPQGINLSGLSHLEIY